MNTQARTVFKMSGLVTSSALSSGVWNTSDVPAIEIMASPRGAQSSDSPIQCSAAVGRAGCAIYTVETHMRYLDEVRAPANLEIESLIFGSDEKRIWFAHEMLSGGTLRATAEFMLLHYNTREGRTTPMPEQVQSALKEAALPTPPDWAGRSVSLQKK